MNPQPVKDSLADCYTEAYEPHATRLNASAEIEPANLAEESAPPEPWYLRLGLRRIPGLRALYYWLSDSRADFVPPVENDCGRAVELGCATGRFLEKLRDAGWQACGIELATAAADEARRRGFEIHTGTLEDAEFAEESFDAACAWMVIEHVPDPRGTLTEIARVLRPDGWLAFSVPNAACWERLLFRSCWYVWEPPRHLQHFTPASIRRLLTDAGFDRIQIIHQRNFLNVVGSLGLVIHYIAPASRLARCLLRFPHNPTMWWQLAMSPLAILLAALKQSGRLTIVARKAGA
ncbi:MAG: class I SAM-dependent methyltransferase [Planctomycetota bacterium]